MRRLLGATIVIALLLSAPAGTAVASHVPDPETNIGLGQLPPSCSDPTGVECENAVIYYLNQARATMGLPPYRLPPGFPQLPADRQIFILSNVDRLAYSLPPVAGLNSQLSADAERGVAAGGDPLPSPWPYGWSSWYSNWAGSFINAPAAYFEWVYNDGFESGNIDCQQPSNAGCWGHRHNFLFQGWDEGAEVEAAMGAATGKESGSGETGYATLVLASSPRFDPAPPYYYSWAEAQAEGAGTYPYDPGVPDLSSVAIAPPGPRLVSPDLRLRLRRGKLRVGGARVLRGQRVTIAIRREWVPCAIDLGAARCGWVQRGPLRRRALVIARKASIRLRPPSAWERLAVHARVAGFESDGRHYGPAAASLELSGPKPHRYAR
jgi:hypothetical protein